MTPVESGINFWQDRRVVVTGGAGFLGSFLVERLRQRGATDIFVPLIEDYNLVKSEDIQPDAGRFSS